MFEAYTMYAKHPSRKWSIDRMLSAQITFSFNRRVWLRRNSNFWGTEARLRWVTKQNQHLVLQEVFHQMICACLTFFKWTRVIMVMKMSPQMHGVKKSEYKSALNRCGGDLPRWTQNARVCRWPGYKERRLGTGLAEAFLLTSYLISSNWGAYGSNPPVVWTGQHA